MIIYDELADISAHMHMHYIQQLSVVMAGAWSGARDRIQLRNEMLSSGGWIVEMHIGAVYTAATTTK